MPNDDKALPTSACSQVDDEIRGLARDVEERLARFAASDVARRKLVTLLMGHTRAAANERLTVRARKFAEQAGRCASCFLPFGLGRRPAPMLEASPLVCLPCRRDGLRGRKHPAIKKT